MAMPISAADGAADEWIDSWAAGVSERGVISGFACRFPEQTTDDEDRVRER